MKEEKPKKVNKVFIYILGIFIIAFVALYLSQATGYYAFENHKKAVFTEEQIRRFEQDVADGKNIDINDYLENTNKNYQSKTSYLGLKVSESIGKNVKKGLEGVFKFLGKMVE